MVFCDNTFAENGHWANLPLGSEVRPPNQCPDGSSANATTQPALRQTILGNFSSCLQRNSIPDSRNVAMAAVQQFNRGCGQTLSAPLQASMDMNRILLDGFFQDLAKRSLDQVDCRVNFFDQYFQNQSKKNQFQESAHRAYDRIRERLEPLVIYAQSLKQQIDMGDSLMSACTGNPNSAGTCFEADQVVEARINLPKVNQEIAKLIVQMPLGYEPDVAASILNMAAAGAYDASEMERGLAAARGKYQQSSDTYRRNAVSAENGHIHFCLDDEYRQFATQTGQSEKLLDSYPPSTIDPITKTILRCQMRSEYVVSASRLNWGMTGLFVGAAVASAVATGGTSILAAGVAVGSTAVAAVGALTAVNQAYSACMRAQSSTTYIVGAVAGQNSCNAQQDYDHALQESTWNQCYLDSGLAAAATVAIPLEAMNAARTLRASRGAAGVLRPPPEVAPVPAPASAPVARANVTEAAPSGANTATRTARVSTRVRAPRESSPPTSRTQASTDTAPAAARVRTSTLKPNPRNGQVTAGNPNDFYFSGRFDSMAEARYRMRIGRIEDPDIRATAQAVREKLTSVEDWQAYIRQLQNETKAAMLASGNPEMIRLANSNILVRSYMLRILVQRARASGESVTSIVNYQVDFESVASNGAFLDRAFEKADSSIGGHGVDMHFIQRDFVRGVIQSHLGTRAPEFWQTIISTKLSPTDSGEGLITSPGKGNIWDAIFDSDEATGTSPEALKSRLPGFLPVQ